MDVTKHIRGCWRLDNAVATRRRWVAHLRLQRGGRSFVQQTFDFPYGLLDLSNQNKLKNGTQEQSQQRTRHSSFDSTNRCSFGGSSRLDGSLLGS